jgi:putative transposase
VRKSRYSDEQIAAALRQAEIGTPVADITRKLGISEATFYAWKKRFGTLGTPEIRELRQLREENAKLKAVVADLTLDRAVLQDVLKKKWCDVDPVPWTLAQSGRRKSTCRNDTGTRTPQSSSASSSHWSWPGELPRSWPTSSSRPSNRFATGLSNRSLMPAIGLMA